MPRKMQKNSITSPEKTAKINKSNMRLKDDFMSYLRSVRRSEGTIHGYDSDLLIVMTYIMEQLDNKDFAKLSKRDIIAFQNWMVSNGNSPARIRRVKAAISSLSNYIENIVADDEPELAGYRSIVRKIENPALTPVREKTVWADGELEQLLDQLMERKQFRKACFLALAAYGGRRKSELCRFRVSDFDDSRVVCNGALYKSAPILTKGSKMLECYTLKKKFDPYLKAWMDERVAQGVESEWLFPLKSDPSQHMDATTANSWANTFSAITGRDFYWHSLRHSFVSYLIRSGIPDSVVVDILGWSSMEMLKVYNDNPKDDQISMYFDESGEINTSGKKSLGDM